MERRRKKGRDLSIQWFTTQKARVAWAGPDKSQEPGASSVSPTVIQGPKHLGHL